MSENFNAPYFDYPLENEFNYDWAMPGYPQPSHVEFTGPIPGRDIHLSDRVNPKVAIPRTSQPSSWTSSGRCSYGDRKREKMAKQLNDLTLRVETFDALLRDLYPKLDVSLAQQVDETLRELNARTPLTQTIPSVHIPALFTQPSGHINHSILSPAYAGVSIPSAGDYTEEDFNGDEKVQATGFVGEHSEMVWLYRLKRGLDHNRLKITKETPVHPSISSVNYFQDNSEILVPDDIDLVRRPPIQIANRLVDTYFHIVHHTFPIIGKAIFLNQYRSFYANPNVRPGKRWIIVLNLVFAIATRHSFLVDQDQTNCDDHQTYFARAWRLNVLEAHWTCDSIGGDHGFKHSKREREHYTLFERTSMSGRPPCTADIFCSTPLPVPFAEEDFLDKRVVQLITDQKTRSTFYASLISHPVEALPRESMTPSTPGQQGTDNEKQEERGSQTGVESVTPNCSLYFLYAVDLAHLLREAINILYAPRAIRQSWHDIEAAISTLNNHADNWLSRLPAEFDFTTLDTTHQFLRQRASLAFGFYSTKLIILQPCIRRLSQSSEANSPGTVCEHMAALCAQAADQMLVLLPEEPDLNWLYGVTPWWCILHNIMQSTTILLTELFTRTHEGTTKAVYITKKINKAIRWLKEMSTKDLCSQRAWLVCMNLVSRHGSKFGFDVETEL
ncbi:uncharacterized protein PGRI_066410 [Penicillium griseofulvum]|uniref:Transcription factor n=1 Tax=Penicillium patulum TaxID=5078 RepID=A0A135LQ94_PENPA|nr:uncharacterized protein PGRI_066410 [Penicillium griseofulvum]KXG51069.1 hypothetical protein PGRI_066410 [Penicillium griseofulvum]